MDNAPIWQIQPVDSTLVISYHASLDDLIIELSGFAIDYLRECSTTKGAEVANVLAFSVERFCRDGTGMS